MDIQDPFIFVKVLHKIALFMPIKMIVPNNLTAASTSITLYLFCHFPVSSPQIICMCVCVCVQSDSECSMNAQSVVDGGGGGVSRDPSASHRVLDPPAEPRSNSIISGPSLVRRVVSRVKEEPPPTLVPNKPASIATSVPKSIKPPTSASQNDDISVGLTSLMGRGRTKDHRSRSRAGKETKESEGNPKPVEETKQEARDETSSPPSATVMTKSEATPTVACGPAPEKHPVNSFTESIPKTKPDPLAPLARSSCFSQSPKPDPLAPPVGFVPAPKRDTFAPVAGFIPRAKVVPLAPPAGFIPAQRPTAVRKPEVQKACDIVNH